MEGDSYYVDYQYIKGYEDLRDTLIYDKELFLPIAVIPNTYRDTSTEKCKEYIDVSRKIVLEEPGVGPTALTNLTTTPYQQLWLPEAIEGTVVEAKDISVGKEMLSIIPNPASTHITVNASGDQSVKVFNAIGQVIFQGSFNGQMEIDMSPFQNGVYYVECIDQNDKKQIQKILKQ